MACAFSSPARADHYSQQIGALERSDVLVAVYFAGCTCRDCAEPALLHQSAAIFDDGLLVNFQLLRGLRRTYDPIVPNSESHQLALGLPELPAGSYCPCLVLNRREIRRQYALHRSQHERRIFFQFVQCNIDHVTVLRLQE